MRPGDPLAVPGQGPVEGLLHVTTPILVDLDVDLPRRRCPRRPDVVTVAILSRPGFDAMAVDHASVHIGEAREIHRDTSAAGRGATWPTWTATVTATGSSTSISAETGLTCPAGRVPLAGSTRTGKRIVHDGRARFGRDFAMAQDWTLAEGVSFWFYGQGSGSTFQVEVKDNRAADPGPSGLGAALERRVRRSRRPATGSARLRLRRWRRLGQQHHGLGQQRAAVLHDRSRQRRRGWGRATS